MPQPRKDIPDFIGAWLFVFFMMLLYVAPFGFAGFLAYIVGKLLWADAPWVFAVIGVVAVVATPIAWSIAANKDDGEVKADCRGEIR